MRVWIQCELQSKKHQSPSVCMTGDKCSASLASCSNEDMPEPRDSYWHWYSRFNEKRKWDLQAASRKIRKTQIHGCSCSFARMDPSASVRLLPSFLCSVATTCNYVSFFDLQIVYNHVLEFISLMQIYNPMPTDLWEIALWWPPSLKDPKLFSGEINYSRAGVIHTECQRHCGRKCILQDALHDVSGGSK